MPQARIVGLSWPEFQLRQAQRVGAKHIVVLAERVSRDIVEAIDRLRAEALSVTLIRSAAEAANLFHPEEAVLLLSGSAIVESARLDALLDVTGPAILCLRGPASDPRFELIDAQDRWVGFAGLSGGQVRELAEDVGEWDFASILLRSAVRVRAQRIVLSEHERLADADERDARIGAARSMLAAIPPSYLGWGARWVIDPIARLVARSAIDVLPVLARFAPAIAAALLIASPGATIFGGLAIGCSMFLVAAVLTSVSRLAAGVTGYPLQLKRTLPLLTAGAALVVLAVATWPGSSDLTQPLAAVVLVGLVTLTHRLGMDMQGPFWLADMPGHTVTLLVGSLFGHLGVTLGLLVTVAHSFATLAWRQSKLSAALTR